MFEINISDVTGKLDEMARKFPEITKRKVTEFLQICGVLLKSKSVEIASREAKNLGQYMGSFMIDNVKQDSDGYLFIKVWNQQLYSMVAEIGGDWTEFPNWYALDQWVNAKFAPKNATEAKRLQFAVAVAIWKRSQRGEYGQLWKHSKVPGRGRVKTMQRAARQRLVEMGMALGMKMKEALLEITASGEKL